MRITTMLALGAAGATALQARGAWATMTDAWAEAAEMDRLVDQLRGELDDLVGLAEQRRRRIAFIEEMRQHQDVVCSMLRDMNERMGERMSRATAMRNHYEQQVVEMRDVLVRTSTFLEQQDLGHEAEELDARISSVIDDTRRTS